MVDSLYILAEQIVLWYFMIVGVSLLLNARVWVQLVEWMLSWEARKLQFFTVMYCISCLPFGLFFVLVHNEWMMSYSVVVTILGWIICVKCAGFLMYPQSAVKCTHLIYGNKTSTFLTRYFRIIGVLYVLLGALVWSMHW